MAFDSLNTPRGFTPLQGILTAPFESHHNLIGVVVDFMTPGPSKGTDYQCSIFLQDASSLGSYNPQGGIRIRLFRPASMMPREVEIGDIVMARGLRWRQVMGNTCLVDYTKRAEFLFFASGSIPDEAFKAAHVSTDAKELKFETLPNQVVTKPTAEEQAYIIKLREWAKKNADMLPQPDPTGAPPRPPANTSAAMQHPLPPKPNFSAPADQDGKSYTCSNKSANALVNVNTGALAPGHTNRFAKTPGYGNRPEAAHRAQHGPKYATLENILIDKYHDLAGEVVKIFDSRSNVMDLYISDYTWNNFLFDYKEHNPDPNDPGRDGDPYGYADNMTGAVHGARAGDGKKKWQGPWGKRTILISLFEPHASYVRREVQEGEVVKVRNVRCYRNHEQPVQGKCHTDQVHPEQVNVSKLKVSDPLFQEVHTRKEAYWAERTKSDGGGKHASKAEKRKKKKKRQAEEQRQREAAEAKRIKIEAGEMDVDEPDPEDEDKVEDEGDGEGLFVDQPKDKINPKVLAAHPDRPLLTLSRVLETPFRTYRTRYNDGQKNTVPFTNQKCRVRVRVVDFFPPNLEDFAQSLDDPDYNDVPGSQDISNVTFDDAGTPKERWEWCFHLLVEDARPPPGADPPRLVLTVHGQDAVHLLGMEATDLRYNQQIQSKLRLKMWTLWGDLEELKGQEGWTDACKPSNHTFECCVDEYGILEGNEATGTWKRMHRIRQTVIRDSGRV